MLEEQQVRKLYWRNVELIDSAERLVEIIKKKNVYHQNKQIRIVVDNLKKSLEAISESYDALQKAGLSWDISYVLAIMSRLEEAQKAEDWVFLGDLYKVQLLPAFYELQNFLQGLNIPFAEPEWFQENLEILRNKNPQIYQALSEYNETSNGEYYKDTVYEVELSQQGYYTLALEEHGRRWSLCSNYAPLDEARAFAARIYRPEKEQYLVFGWGMGYHIRALLEKNPDLDILVYEPDLDILYCSFMYTDCKSVLEHVELVWDKDWKRLSELMRNRELVIFQPELPHIPIPSVRQQMTAVANRKDSIDAFQNVFYINARENIRSCSDYIDSLKFRFKGKKVVIVAAGPSLDKNVEKLKGRPENVIIVAVGTVYRLLVQKGILPDYIIVSDCYISHQILGVEAEVPILMLATSDRKIAKEYKGNTYLICQKGYDMAADYAREHGYQTYDSGGSVATLALDVAIRMEAAAIAFIGLDLAYYDNRAHASGTGKEVYGGYEFSQTEGIHGERLNTSQAFTNYRTWMEQRITQEDATMPVIDATEGGARKKGFLLMTLEEFFVMEAPEVYQSANDFDAESHKS